MSRARREAARGASRAPSSASRRDVARAVTRARAARFIALACVMVFSQACSFRARARIRQGNARAVRSPLARRATTRGIGIGHLGVALRTMNSHSPSRMCASAFVDDARAMRSRSIVIVGGGVSAGYLTRALVANGLGSSTTVVGAEAVAPYERPALTKGFLHEESPARLPGFHACVGSGGERQTAAWYAEHGVTLKLSTRVVACDLRSRTVTTDGGETLSYDVLVVATGCGAMTLPTSMNGNAKGVHYVRDHADALKLVDAMERGRKAAVIGGGYVGLEVAATLATRGLKPNVVMMEPHVMARLFTADIAKKYEALYESRGATFHRSTAVKTIATDENGNATGVELVNGDVLEADLIVVGIGATAPRGPFEALDAPEGRLGGIKVDGQFRASGEGVEPGSVYAIGDIAAFPLKLSNELVRMEHVKHARDSATLVGNIIAGKVTDESPYDYTPYFYSRVFEHKGSERPVSWVFYGLQKGDVITIGDFNPTLAAFWIHQGKCVGVMLESGAADKIAALPAAVRSGKSIDVDALRASTSVDQALALIM